jgi:hypothetical protein
MPDRIKIPRSLFTAPVWDQIVFLSALPGGVQVKRLQRRSGERLVFVVEAGDRGGWDPILAKALHALLTELSADERVAS